MRASQTCQAVGAIELDVAELGVDFVTGGTVKYLLGSAGLGFLYVRQELLERLLPTQTGWFADEDIFQMDISDYSPAVDARRFDAGTPPVPNIYGGLAGMSIEQLLPWLAIGPALGLWALRPLLAEERAPG